MATLAVTRRFDLTDAQWAVLEPRLPAPHRPGRPSLWTKRQLIDIRWRVRVGAPWRDVPSCYGSWQAVYRASTSRANRIYLRRRGIKTTIPSKADQDANRRAKGSRGSPRRCPTRQRIVIVLRYFADMADGGIAALLGCSVVIDQRQATAGHARHQSPAALVYPRLAPWLLLAVIRPR